MTMWFDESGNRRGVLSEESFQDAIDSAGAIVLFLAATGASTASAVASGVSGMTLRRATIMLDRLVSAGLATEDGGSYTSVLVEDAG